MSTPIVARRTQGVLVKQRANAEGPQQHRSTNRDRTRSQQKRNQVRDQERNAA